MIFELQRKPRTTQVNLNFAVSGGFGTYSGGVGACSFGFAKALT
jgi:hypothetical protein